MLPREFPAKSGAVVLRLARREDVDQLIALNKLCFPSLVEENVVWNRGQLHNHLRLFPEGQIVAERNGRVVGAVASLIVDLGSDPYRAHTYAGITDGGYFHNHDPQGDTLYGADVYVHPDAQGEGIAHALYEARRELCRRLNLRRILAGGRLHDYAEHAPRFSPEQYVQEVEAGRLRDRVLSFQLREGFVVRGVLRNYIADPLSRNCASLIEWVNPHYRPRSAADLRKVRVACVQYEVRRVHGFGEFAERVEYFVGTAAEYHADFVVFPELFSMQLLSQKGLERLPTPAGIRRLAELETPYVELLRRLAGEYGLHIVGGSHPMQREQSVLNVCPFVFPNGELVLQPKLHVTPTEREHWGISGGNELRVISTPAAKIGVLICYDVEFPETARYLADQGAEIVFVPYCTDNREAHLRVRYCCQARAVENQLFVVSTGVVGNLPGVTAMDIHYGQAAIHTPCDFQFARDGVQAEADSNVEMLLVNDLDIQDIHRVRATGSVTPLRDRRKDLFELQYRPRADAGESTLTDSPPIEPAPHVDVLGDS